MQATEWVGPTLYGGNSGGEFFEIDQDTGDLTLVVDIDYGIYALAYDGINLYGGSNKFYTIDPGDGSTTLITDTLTYSIYSMAYYNGVLYGGGSGAVLFTIDPATGSQTLIGAGTHVVTSLAVYNGVMYGTNFYTFFSIDMNTGAQTDLGLLDRSTSGMTVDSQPVAIDIKPGSSMNSINLSSKGAFPVAILSSDLFDATDVDPETISLAGASVKAVGKEGKLLCKEKDVNEDGWLDLVCHVLTSELLLDQDATVATLEAETYGGEPFQGEDSVNIVPKN